MERRILSDNPLLAAIGVSILFWFVEAGIHASVFHTSTFAHAVFAPSLNEVWLRLMVAGAILSFGIYGQYTITGRRRAEESLKKYAEQLEEADRTKGLFMDIITHDLLTPTSVIMNATELMEDWGLDEEQEETRGIMEGSAKRLMEMIEGARMYSKLESLEKIEREQLDLGKTLRKVAKDFKPLLEKKKMTLKYLPKGKCCVPANPVIGNAFSNLLSNAIKYSPEGGKIEVNLLDEGDWVKVYFKDWGCGIGDEDKARLFNRFQRIEKGGVKGSGLGLAIVKRVVELHNGRVWLEDNPEGGCVFFVSLPKAD